MTDSDEHIKVLYFVNDETPLLNTLCLDIPSFEYVIYQKKEANFTLYNSYNPDVILVDHDSVESTKHDAEWFKKLVKRHHSAVIIRNLPQDEKINFDTSSVSSEIMPQDFYHIVHNHKILNTIQRKYHQSENVDSEAYLSLKQKYDEDQDILKNSLKQIALMVEERDRFRILTDEYQKKNALFIDEFVSLLMELIEKKQSYHGGHSGKVKDISSFIAKEMKLPEKMRKYIESAGWMDRTNARKYCKVPIHLATYQFR